MNPAMAITLLLFLFALGIALVLWIRLRRLGARQAAERERAVARAREEFSRDVHDLVGHWLWLASVKSELAYRQAGGDTRLRSELAEALQAVRHAAHAVRNASTSHRNLSFQGEVLRAEALLWGLGIDCLTHGDTTGLPPDLNAALAAVVREGVTNMLRHSAAGKCVIDLRREESRLSLTVANDGASGPGRFPHDRSRPTPPSGAPVCASSPGSPPVCASSPGSPPVCASSPGSPPVCASSPGSPPASGPWRDPRPRAGGLDNLRQRMASVGGTVSAAAGPDGWFRLVAEAPADFSE
ncbi:sensor histidine kinase [Planobispora rosea]|uniref:sensor histidine kinase n=1 Tax=Planobispora rosea TaxID=35762 RepID=UPI00159F2C55|nr:histidine kinase [Planobispora rosea]